MMRALTIDERGRQCWSLFREGLPTLHTESVPGGTGTILLSTRRSRFPQLFPSLTAALEVDPSYSRKGMLQIFGAVGPSHPTRET